VFKPLLDYIIPHYFLIIVAVLNHHHEDDDTDDSLIESCFPPPLLGPLLNTKDSSKISILVVAIII